jgi:hypothetical protein
MEYAHPPLTAKRQAARCLIALVTVVFFLDPSFAAQPSPRYLGPPANIDGPEPLPPAALPPATLPPAIMPPGRVTTPIAPRDVPPFDGPGPAIEMFPDSPLEDQLLILDTPVVQPQKLHAYKDSFFQKLSLAVDWLGNGSDPADLGITEVEVFAQVGLPLPIKEWPLLITPGYEMTFVKGPSVTDVPPRLYMAYADFMWLPQIVKGHTLLLSVVPNVFGDFDAHQFRLTGKGLYIYDAIPERLQLVGGVLYLNRENIRLLPAGGAIWNPNEWTHLELIFPKPKFAFRYNVGPGFEDWFYGTAEFGGNTWPILRTGGVRDNFTYVDYRLLVGIERKLDGGAGYRLEAGYVFGRSVSFTSGRGDFDPQDTFMLRGGIMY